MSRLKGILAMLALCAICPRPAAAGAAEDATAFFNSHPNAVDVRMEGDSILFANRQIGIELRKTPSGFQLGRLYGIADKQEFLATGGRDLFEIRMILDPKFAGKDERWRTQPSLMGIVDEMAADAFSIGSSAAKAVSCRSEQSDKATVLRLEWKGMDAKEEKEAVDATVTVTLREDDPLSHWRITVRNRAGRYGVERVRFPMVTFAPIGKPEENALIIPQSRGRILDAPFKQQSVAGYYTCDFEMQFQSLYNKQSGAGVYLATQQSTPCLSHLQIACTPSEISWAPAHFPPNIGFSDFAEDGLDFEVPYDCVVGPFHGDWFDACQIYRDWALKQSWCSKGPLSQRKDIPKWYKEAPLYFYSMLNDSAEGTHSMNDNLHIGADHFSEWLKWAGVKMPANFYGWEQPVHGLSARDVPFVAARSQLMGTSGRWSGMTGHNFYDGNYPAIKALPDFSSECRRLRKEGGMVCPYIALEIFNQGPTENAPYVAEAKPNAIRDLYGSIRTWGGEGAWQMCSWSPWWRERLKETCLQLLSREHVGGLYMDVMRGSSLPCYWTPHGHSAAGGSSMTTGRHELLATLREAIKAKDRDAIMTGENPSENMIDVIDGMLIFTLWGDNAPLLATVYQGYIPRYGLEVSTGMGWNNRFKDVYRPDSFFIECASLFCEGTQVGRLRLRPREASLSLDNPAQKEMIDFLAQIVGYYKQDGAKKYLVYGQLMRPLVFNSPAPMPALTYTAMYVRTAAEFPALMSGVFKAEDGSLGVFVVNASSTDLNFASELVPSKYGIPDGARLNVEMVASNGDARLIVGDLGGNVPLGGLLPAHGITMFRIEAVRL